MAEVGMSKSEFQEMLRAMQATNAETLAAAIRAAREPNPIEQKQIEEQLEAEKRRVKLMVEIGKAEELAAQRRKNGCTHTRHPQGSKNGGQTAPKGQGEWCTGGQLHNDQGKDIAHLLCLRCSWGWKWNPSYEEREYILNVGMLGMAPPAPERIIWEG